ncbi:MAG: SPOR domain-containing protein [Polaribacter sp.]|nr:SPOR domain-containing protein [Polaribacter sp.]
MAQNINEINNDVKTLISKKREFNKKFGFGYRVQLYYGDENNAKSIQSKFNAAYSDTKSYLVYQQPYWKVLVGDYKNKLEADRASVLFSEKFSGLIVVPLGKIIFLKIFTLISF